MNKHANNQSKQTFKESHATYNMTTLRHIVQIARFGHPLLAILSLASVLRFYGLENQSLWYDELVSWAQSNHVDLSGVINEGVRPDVHPPGYQVVLYFIEKHIGDSETILRFPSAICGVLAVVAIYVVGKRLYSRKEGLIASAFMAVLWCPIFYSQEARPYSMLLLFTLLASYYWILLIRKLSDNGRPSYYTMLGYVLTAVISSYLHYFGLYLVVLHGLAAALFLISRRKTLIYVGLIYIAILLAYLPWLPMMYEDLGRGPIWIEPPTWKAFILYLNSLFNHSKGLLLAVLFLYFSLALSGAYGTIKEKTYLNVRRLLLSSGSLLVLWLIVPFIGVYMKSIVSTPVLTNRNLIISLPAAYLLLSRSITRLPLRSRHQGIVIFIILVLMLGHLVFRVKYYSVPQKEQFREAVEYILDREQLYENSLIVGYTGSKACFDYYFEKRGSDRRVDVIAGKKEHIERVGEILSSENKRYVWYITAHLIPDEEFIRFLTRKLTLYDHKKLRGAEIWLFLS